MNKKVNLILGTMNYGVRVDQDTATEMAKIFMELGYSEFDTAYVYNEGASEKILGKSIITYDQNQYSVATKVNPRITGNLNAESINSQFDESLMRLGLPSVDILYIHFPDSNTPLEISLKACDELFRLGKIKELGLSNFPAWMVVDAWHICNKNGWIVPTVYQGVYNVLSRKAEEELFPALRKLGIRFYAYNPLAGGILSGKYQDYNEMPQEGRFIERPNYKDRYWKPSYFEALKLITESCEKYGITVIEASYRWLAYHSYLNSDLGDGILIGVSKLSQLTSNIESINNGSLPSDIITTFNKAFSDTKMDSPNYFRQATKK